MSTDEINELKKLLNTVNENLELARLELLKEDEMMEVKYKIEDSLKEIKNDFGKIERLKIEKAIPSMRNELKHSHTFVGFEKAKLYYENLEILINELIEISGGFISVKAVPSPKLDIGGNNINKALEDARLLIEKNGANSALDRMHTVLHAFLKNICDENKTIYSNNNSITELFKKMRESHPIFNQKDEKIGNILNSFANIIDKLNSIRNNESLAHANKKLIDNDEANLVIDSINSILRYISSKIEK